MNEIKDNNPYNLVTVEEVKKAILFIEGVPKCKNLTEILRKLVAGHKDSKVLSIIDKHAYVDAILWEEDDIKTALKDNGFKDSKENIDAVICELEFNSISERSIPHGWDAIYSAIFNVETELEKKGR